MLHSGRTKRIFSGKGCIVQVYSAISDKRRICVDCHSNRIGNANSYSLLEELSLKSNVLRLNPIFVYGVSLTVDVVGTFSWNLSYSL